MCTPRLMSVKESRAIATKNSLETAAWIQKEKLLENQNRNMISKKGKIADI